MDLRTALQSATEADTALRKGLWVSFLDPYGLEVVARSGVDWLGIDLQHGNVELHDLSSLLRVAELVGLPVMARVRSHDAAALGRVLDCGVSGVIVPLVESAAQAQAIVSACRIPPEGSRSSGGCRSTLGLTHHPSPQLVLLMVETAAGLDHAGDILAVSGVDGVFVGPYDLSISAGFPGPESPQTIEALRHVIGLARRAGKPVGFMGGRPALNEVAGEADLVALDTDVAALRTGIMHIFG